MTSISAFVVVRSNMDFSASFALNIASISGAALAWPEDIWTYTILPECDVEQGRCL